MVRCTFDSSSSQVLRRVSIAKVRQRLVNLGLLATDICLSQRQVRLSLRAQRKKIRLLVSCTYAD